ncbi:mechanosensitive ion channel family protein [Ochrobactrum vermis]|uniref:Mechanosensitive ion channel family protein n=1 Tax=Ochrobactrum vermis TaxID=1827297 RepID=A0ABU8PMS3_9HYPH|nr:mechanosensitive ion channel family protein [Ochrobactrum vermis]PQZ26966.1 mechanosensitive ion channel protein MscS [Ochrobactrum vermis]
MGIVVVLRTCAMVLITLILLSILQGIGWAQGASDQVPPEKVRQLLEVLNEPDVKAWLEHKAAPQSAAAPALSDMFASWETAVRNRLVGLADAVPRIPQEMANAADIIARDVNYGRPGLVILILAVLLTVGFGAEWLVRQLLSKKALSYGRDWVPQVVLTNLAALLTFTLASIGSFLALEWPPLLRGIVLTLLVAIITFRLVRAICSPATILLAMGASALPDQPSDDTMFEILPEQQMDVARVATASFWRWRISVIVGIFLFGWAIVSIMRIVGFSPEVSQIGSHLLGLGLLAVAIEVVWHQPGRRPLALKGVLLTLFLIALWLAWVGGMLGLLWIGIYALMLPPVLRGTGRLAQALAGNYKPTGAVGVIFDVIVARGARALVIGVAVVWLAYLWKFSAAALSENGLGERLVNGVFNAIIILVVADLLWQLSKVLIDYQLRPIDSADSSGAAIARSGRLRTLLPIFRNALAAFIAIVAVLTILSGMGVQILPLIAGAGIFGVAVGFGAQTLVKDILSGVFYMLDDAFRVGEYIQSGSYKGTVESFSLRSIRLRHHRGPVFTVPFGQLGAIQNMSRDWVIEKMTIGVTHNSDVELARKLIKQIGLELAADPEFAADTIEPLKMQGIDSFGEYSIMLRMKLMTKPGTQFSIKRRANMMIKKAFEENGIKIAYPTVHVEGGSDTAAASHEIVRKIQAEAAATEAKA